MIRALAISALAAVSVIVGLTQDDAALVMVGFSVLGGEPMIRARDVIGHE